MQHNTPANTHERGEYTRAKALHIWHQKKSKDIYDKHMLQPFKGI